jgi:hypothetical protein
MNNLELDKKLDIILTTVHSLVNTESLKQDLKWLVKTERIDENLACQQIMATNWKTSEMIEAASKRQKELEAVSPPDTIRGTHE